MRRALVVAQVALSLVLVVGALLFVRSLRNLMTLDAGFRQDGILVVNLDLRRAGVPDERRTALFADITAKIGALPGVTSAAQAFIVPVSGSGWNENIVIDGKKYSDNVNFNRGQRRLLQDHGHAAAGRARLRRPRSARRREVGDRHRAVRAQVLRRPGSDRQGVPARRAAGSSADARSHRRRRQGHEVHRPARGIHAAGVLRRVAGRASVSVPAGRAAIVGAAGDDHVGGDVGGHPGQQQHHRAVSDASLAWCATRWCANG